MVGLLLIGLALLVMYWLVEPLGPRSFPDDHGISADSPLWVRCVAETIERQPPPLTTDDFRLTQTGQTSFVIDGAFRTFEITVVEGFVVYRWWRGDHFISLDCPEVGLVSAESRRREGEVAAALRPCGERYGVRVMAEGEGVRIELSADAETIRQCGYRGDIAVRIVGAEDEELLAWSGGETAERSETNWVVTNWCRQTNAWVRAEWQNGSTSEPFGPAPACTDPDAPPDVAPAP